LTADELSNVKRAAKGWHPLAQISLERGFIEAMILADRCDVIVEQHYLELPV
jgi:hypothetical protein